VRGVNEKLGFASTYLRLKNFEKHSKKQNVSRWIRIKPVSGLMQITLMRTVSEFPGRRARSALRCLQADIDAASRLALLLRCTVLRRWPER